MQLASLINRHPHALAHLSNRERSAANAITGCRTQQYGQLLARCEDCDAPQVHQHSCGHRNCPQCLNHNTSEWLDRQSRKLLPCAYFMVTFTLPKELRSLAKQHPVIVYNALMSCAASTLKTFAKNDAKCGEHIGLTVVLHTHTRRLDYHPHAHVVIPNGGLSKDKRLWQVKPGAYLFNSRALSTVFRARLLKQLHAQGLTLPSTPKRWVVHAKKMGQGLPALQYLSRYLYRGVISEKNIISDRDGQITFAYRDNTQQRQTRTLDASAFLKLVLQHVLPKGFRRVRDYGFLHGNAKATLRRVQWALQVTVPQDIHRERPVWSCPHCAGVMHIVAVRYRRIDSG